MFTFSVCLTVELIGAKTVGSLDFQVTSCHSVREFSGRYSSYIVFFKNYHHSLFSFKYLVLKNLTSFDFLSKSVRNTLYLLKLTLSSSYQFLQRCYISLYIYSCVCENRQ